MLTGMRKLQVAYIAILAVLLLGRPGLAVACMDRVDDEPPPLLATDSAVDIAPSIDWETLSRLSSGRDLCPPTQILVRQPAAGDLDGVLWKCGRGDWRYRRFQNGGAILAVDFRGMTSAVSCQISGVTAGGVRLPPQEINLMTTPVRFDVATQFVRRPLRDSDPDESPLPAIVFAVCLTGALLAGVGVISRLSRRRRRRS
jgi:hypothetical protein